MKLYYFIDFLSTVLALLIMNDFAKKKNIYRCSDYIRKGSASQTQKKLNLFTYNLFLINCET